MRLGDRQRERGKIEHPEFKTSNKSCANMPEKNVAVLILCDNESKILLQHRTKDAPTYPDHWAFFGGGIEAGESAEQAVRRESFEELGYELTAPRLFVAQKFIYRGSEHTKHVFVEQYNGATLILGEGQAMGWFLASETRGLLINDHDRSIIGLMQKFLSRDRS